MRKQQYRQLNVTYCLICIQETRGHECFFTSKERRGIERENLLGSMCQRKRTQVLWQENRLRVLFIDKFGEKKRLERKSTMRKQQDRQLNVTYCLICIQETIGHECFFTSKERRGIERENLLGSTCQRK